MELYNSGQNSFYSDLTKMSEHFNFYDFNDNSLSDSRIKKLIDLMKKKYVSVFGTRRPSSLHHSIKKNYGSFAYLDSTPQNTSWNIR